MKKCPLPASFLFFCRFIRRFFSFNDDNVNIQREDEETKIDEHFDEERKRRAENTITVWRNKTVRT